MLHLNNRSTLIAHLYKSIGGLSLFEKIGKKKGGMVGGILSLMINR